MSRESEWELLVPDAAGIYLPQEFIKGYIILDWEVDPVDAKIIEAGPEHDDYWEAWDAIVAEARYEDDKGNVWELYQEGDLWAVPEDYDWEEEGW